MKLYSKDLTKFTYTGIETLARHSKEGKNKQNPNSISSYKIRK